MGPECITSDDSITCKVAKKDMRVLLTYVALKLFLAAKLCEKQIRVDLKL